MKVLVTDGDNRAALAVTRSLGRAGHTVMVGERRDRSLAGSSRYCSSRVTYPDPTRSSDAFLERLAALVRDYHVEALLPASDITTLLVTANRDRFEPSCAIPFAPVQVIERAADKIEVFRTAARLGLPLPRSVVVERAQHVPEDLGFNYPIVIKPHRSRIRTTAGWASACVSYATDRQDLELQLAGRPGHEFPFLLQERVIGPGIGVFACYHAGRPVAPFSHKRIRERPPWGGVGVLTESTPMCPIAQEFATCLLGELGWEGVAMVEFKRDVADDLPKLMEVNGRFWGSLELAIAARVDFPSLLLRSIGANEFSPQLPYRVGVRNRWLWGDIDALLVTLFGGRGAPSFERPHRARAILQFLNFWGRGLHYENPMLSDLRPWLFESGAWFRRAAKDALSPILRPRH